jgi:hypothetical protein
MGALSATVLVGGMCAGAAGAGPDSQPNADPPSRSSKGNLIGSTLGALGALTRGHGSAQPVRTMLAVPRVVVGAVRDTAARATGGGSGRPAPTPTATEKVPPQEVTPQEAAPEAQAPAVDEASVPPVAPSAIVVTVPAPAAPAPITVTIPLPRNPFTPATVYSVDLTGPIVAYSSVQNTYETVNTLATDSLQPYNPFRGLAPAPKPDPQPQLKVYEKEGIGAEPSIVDVGGSSHSGSAGMENLGVVRMPMVAPAAARLAPPRPLYEARTPAAVSEGLVGGGAAPVVRGSEGLVGGGAAPVLRGPEVRTATQGAEPPLNNATSQANPPPQQGFLQYPRNARMVELTSVALPGLAGLLALTVSGGVIGYRQANSVRYLRSDAGRFLT